MANQPPTEFKPSPQQKPASMATYKRELRKEIKKRALEPEINFLNITAMMDMMTIILVFLLKSMSRFDGRDPAVQGSHRPQERPSDRSVAGGARRSSSPSRASRSTRTPSARSPPTPATASRRGTRSRGRTISTSLPSRTRRPSGASGIGSSGSRKAKTRTRPRRSSWRTSRRPIVCSARSSSRSVRRSSRNSI